jgi:hypothetical protein
MAQANLPISFLGDALMVATYILNRVSFKSVPSTPYELWSGKKQDLSNWRPWGAQVMSTMLPTNMENWALEQINVYLSHTLMNLRAM